MLRGMVAHHLGLKLAHDPLHLLVPHVHVHEAGPLGHVAAPPAAVLPERIEDQHLMPGGHIRIGDMRPDETGPAGDDDPHAFKSS